MVDVGTGDGLLGIEAAAHVGAAGEIIFVDLSDDALAACSRQLSMRGGIPSRTRLLKCSAESLALPDASADVVLMGSVLLFVNDKRSACEEAHRVLRDGGRLGVYDPVNSFGLPEPEDRFAGYDVGPVLSLARKVKDAYPWAMPGPGNPLLSYTERDLVTFAHAAGFREVRATSELSLVPNPPRRWHEMIETAPNPFAPTLGAAIADRLDPDEQRRFVAHLRPLVELGAGYQATAHTFLVAS